MSTNHTKKTSRKTQRGTRKSAKRRAKTFGRPRQEIKGTDYNLPTSGVLNTVNTSGGMYLMNGLIMGTGSWNRLGRQIQMKSLQYKLLFSLTLGNLGATLPSVAPALRILLVYDKQPNLAVPNFDGIFSELDNAGVQSTTVYSGLDYGRMKRFTILRDKLINPDLGGLMTDASPAQNAVTYHVHEDFIKLKRLTTEYDSTGSAGNTGTIGDIMSGALYLIFRSNFATADQGQWQIRDDSFCRLRYFDN